MVKVRDNRSENCLPIAAICTKMRFHFSQNFIVESCSSGSYL